MDVFRYRLVRVTMSTGKQRPLPVQRMRMLMAAHSFI